MNWYMLQFPKLPIQIPGMKTHTMFYAETDVFMLVQLALKAGIVPSTIQGIPIAGAALYEYTPSGWRLVYQF